MQGKAEVSKPMGYTWVLPNLETQTHPRGARQAGPHWQAPGWPHVQPVQVFSAAPQEENLEEVFHGDMGLN